MTLTAPTRASCTGLSNRPSTWASGISTNSFASANTSPIRAPIEMSARPGPRPRRQPTLGLLDASAEPSGVNRSRNRFAFNCSAPNGAPRFDVGQRIASRISARGAADEFRSLVRSD